MEIFLTKVIHSEVPPRESLSLREVLTELYFMRQKNLSRMNHLLGCSSAKYYQRGCNVPIMNFLRNIPLHWSVPILFFFFSFQRRIKKRLLGYTLKFAINQNCLLLRRKKNHSGFSPNNLKRRNDYLEVVFVLQKTTENLRIRPLLLLAGTRIK